MSDDEQIAYLHHLDRTRPQTPWIAAFRPHKPFPADLERQFLTDFNGRMLPFRRTVSWVGYLLWLSFLLWDHLLLDGVPGYAQVAGSIAAVRIGVFVVQCVLHWLHYSPASPLKEPLYAEALIVSGCSLTFAAQCLFVIWSPAPFGQFYYLMGSMVVVSACVGLFCVRARPALLMAGIQSLLTVATLAWLHWRSSGPASGMVTLSYTDGAAIYIFSTIGVGCAVSQFVETLSRHNFVGRRLLEQHNCLISQHGDDLRGLNAALEQSSTDARIRLEAVIELKERLRLEAEKRSVEKSQFIASAVHDLRQPVQAIMSALLPVTLAVDRGDRAQAVELLSLSRRAIHSMQAQLAAILDISQLESGGVRPTLTDVDVVSELLLVKEQMQCVADQAGVSLVIEPVDMSPGQWFSRSDPSFLRRILVNLISNGIKYRAHRSGEHARVVLRVHEQAGGLCIQVADNGLGIQRALLDTGQIFLPFFQANNQLAQSDKGVGLGLTIVRALTKLLPQHRLSVASTHGQGSTFSLALPQLIGSERPVTKVITAIGPTKSALGLYVLLVEDDDLVRLATASLLQSIGVRHESYATFEEIDAALPLLERLPDVVLSDYRLPNGRTAVDVKRALDRHEVSAAMIVFSGEATNYSLNSDLDGLVLLRKPVSAEMLVAALFKAAGQAQPAEV